MYRPGSPPRGSTNLVGGTNQPICLRSGSVVWKSFDQTVILQAAVSRANHRFDSDALPVPSNALDGESVQDEWTASQADYSLGYAKAARVQNRRYFGCSFGHA